MTLGLSFLTNLRHHKQVSERRAQLSGESAMDYDELVAKVMELLQREKHVPYRALKRRFNLDDEYIEDLKVEIIQAKRLAVDEDGVILVWVGSTPSVLEPTTVPATPLPSTEREREPLSYTPRHPAEKILTSRSALELSPVYNWFTEGFDPADLKDAKTLLDELAEEISREA
jgi:hypothetical protein